MKHGATSAPPAPHLDEHTCLDFLQGFLTDAENERTLRHIEECAACETLLRKRAAERERFRATLRPVKLPTGELILTRSGSARRRHPLTELWRRIRAAYVQPRRWVLLAPAALAAVFLVILLWPDAPLPQIHPLPPYQFELQSRDPLAAGPDHNLRRGLAAYERGDYATAITLLHDPDQDHEDARVKMLREIFLGSALALEGDYNGAVHVLDQIPLPLIPGEWGQEAHWTLYAALVRSGQTARADSLLTVLANKPGILGERAREAQSR